MNYCRKLELTCTYLRKNYPIITFCGYDDDDDCYDETEDTDDIINTERDDDNNDTFRHYAS